MGHVPRWGKRCRPREKTEEKRKIRKPGRRGEELKGDLPATRQNFTPQREERKDECRKKEKQKRKEAQKSSNKTKRSGGGGSSPRRKKQTWTSTERAKTWDQADRHAQQKSLKERHEKIGGGQGVTPKHQTRIGRSSPKEA